MDIVLNIADILVLAALLWIIQFYIQPTHQNTYITNLLGVESHSWVPVLTILGLFIIKNFCALLLSKEQADFNSKIAIRFSAEKLRAFQAADYFQYVKQDSSKNIRQIAFQPFDYCQYVLGGAQQLITQGSLIGMAIVVILLYNAKIFLLLLSILVLPVWLVFYFVKKKQVALKKSIQEENENSFRFLLDALKGYVEGNLYQRNDFFTNRFIDARAAFSKSLFTSFALQNLPGRIIEIFALTGICILLFLNTYYGTNSQLAWVSMGGFNSCL
jgi:ABC-type multidrug transport system fused ATPase/permease subunit